MPETNPPPPFRILLVEQAPLDRQAFCRAMKEGGIPCDFTECSRADEALERIAATPSPFDLVVVDHLLPDMSGLELCRQAAMRKTPSPLLFLIPAGSETLAAAAIKTGATAYIIKDPSNGYLNLLPVAAPEAIKRYRDRLAHTETEAVLRESEAKYRFITDTMLDMVWIVGLDLQTTYVSPSIERVLGFTPEERKQQSFKGNVTPESYQRVLERLAEELRRDHENAPDPNRSIVIEVEYYRKDGTTLWMENRVQAIRDSKNAIVGIMGVSRDITERREAEAALRESEKKYRTLFENAPIGIGITDGAGNILDFNEAMLRLHGYKPGDTLPSGRTVNYYHNPEERERTVALLLRDGFVDREEVYLKRKDGTPYHGLLSMRPMEMEGKSCWLSMIQDISEQLKKDEALRKSAQVQEVLVREVNHRVKNNLSAIISMIHKEEDHAMATENRERIPLLRDLSSRIQGLLTVHSMLSQSGWRPLNLQTLCEGIIQGTLKGAPFSKKMAIHVAPSPVAVNSNIAHHLALVLNELATNSMKHAVNDRHVCHIAVNIHEDGEQVSICYRDDGPGYPEAMIRESASGENIGFQLIQGIVTRSLGGKVRIENKNGAVTRITFRNSENSKR